MAAADSQYTDLGIVYYKDLSPTGKTYVDKRGKTVDCEELGDEWTPMFGDEAVKTATHFVGVPAAHAYWVYIEVSGGSDSSISVRLVSQYANDPGVAPAVDSGWSRVQMVNEDDGTVANEITLTSGYYLLQTASEHVSGRSRWEAVTNGGPDVAVVRIAGRAV